MNTHVVDYLRFTNNYLNISLNHSSNNHYYHNHSHAVLVDVTKRVSRAEYVLRYVQIVHDFENIYYHHIHGKMINKKDEKKKKSEMYNKPRQMIDELSLNRITICNSQ